MNPNRLFWGVLIIALGILWLLGNLGMLPNDFWQDIWRLWPIIIVFWGISILFGNKQSAGVWLSVAIILIILAGVSIFGILYHQNYESDTISTIVSEDLKLDAESGEIKFDIGAVSLNLKSGSEEFVSGSVKTISGINIQRSNVGSVQKLEISQLPNGALLWGKDKSSNLDLKVSNKLPLDIYINAGATKINADLSESMIKKLEIDSGATSADVKIGNKINNIKINISCGASSFDIKIPNDFSLKVINRSGLSGNNLSSLNLIKNGDEWTSSDYDTNDKKIEVIFESGASSLNISKY